MSETLPAIIDSAKNKLDNARTSAELLEARSALKAASHVAKISKANNEVRAHLLRLENRAQTLLANAVDAGKERGEVARGGKPRRAGSNPPTLDDIGIPSQRLSEWRQVADAGEEVVEAAIQDALDEGRAPTQTDIITATKPHVANNSGNNEWYTPKEYIDAARSAMGGIDLDPASSQVANELVQADKYYTIEDDGLKQEWSGRVWMNPPYAQPAISQFCNAVVEKYQREEISQACVLVNNATETAWFQTLLGVASAVCFIRGRIKFLDVSGNPSGAPLQGQAVVYFGSSSVKFVDEFSKFGIALFK